MDNILFILLYILIFVTSVTLIYYGIILSSTKKKLGIILIILGILAPSIMAGIRHNVGVDFEAYMKMFHNIEAGRPMYFRSIEPLSTLIITLSANLHNSFLMFFCFSLITNTCFFLAFWRFFKNNPKQTSLAFFFYLCILFPISLNTIRSSIAISIIALIFSYLLQDWSKKTIITSISLLIIATLFHKSALLILLFAPVLWLTRVRPENKSKTKKITLFIIYFAIAALAPLIFLITKNILPLGDYSRYLAKFGSEFSIPLANIIMSIPIFYAIFYLFKNKKAKNNKQFDKLLYCAIFYIPLSVLVGWLSYAKGLSRISFALEPLIIMLMTYLTTLPSKTAKIWKISATICVAIVVSLMFIRNLNWSKALPYQTIFEKEISYATKN